MPGDVRPRFGGACFGTGGALRRTLELLPCRPGVQTRQQPAGRRQRHVLPLRPYPTIRLPCGITLALAMIGVRLRSIPT